MIAAAACSDDGGSGGGSGGGTSKAGSSGGGTAGSTAAGGTAGTTSTGGTAGTSTGGTAGTSTGGTGGGTAYACAGTVPGDALITDFATIGAMGTWGTAPGLTGGIFTYPAAITYDASAGTLDVSGNVADYSGFGLWFGTCADASSFDGLQFDISGDVGASGMITIALQTNSDSPIDAVGMKGACAFASEATKYTDCVSPTVTKAIAGGSVSVTWAEFTGGKPIATADPSEIIGIQWSFSWAGATDTAYMVDVSVDNVSFIGEGTGTGGAGGGGAPSTGGAGGQGGA